MPKKSKNDSQTYKHTHSYLQILGNGLDTGETMPSVLLFFDAYRYVFNVGEGFQRYCFQHRLKLGKLSDVFLTRMSTEAAGGVPGLYITLTESGGIQSPPFRLHGPMNLDRFLNAIRTFINVSIEGLDGSNFGSEITAGILGDPLVQNSQVEIRPILLLPTLQRSEPSSLFLNDGKNEGILLKQKVPAACYVCQLAEVKGRFLPEKAKSLGIRPGPDFAKLVNGESIVSQEGKEVHPHQVMDLSTPGPTVLLIDCPDECYTTSLFSASAFDPYFDMEREGDVVIVHLTPYEIVKEKRYMEWMIRFGKKAEHIFVNERSANATAIMLQATRLQCKLNLIDDRYFPLPRNASSATNAWHPEGSIPGKDLLKYILKPIAKKGVDDSVVSAPFSFEECISSARKDHFSALAAIDAFRRERSLKDSCLVQRWPNELEITFLGTGSAVPSKHRNVTGIYLDFFERGGMILDCGEGSYGQMIRCFGKQGAQDALKKLQFVETISLRLISFF